MTADEENFGNNPFRQLNITAFPKIREKQPANAGIDPADRDLFLHAVHNLPQEAKQKRSGFLLAEQCTMPVMKKKKTEQPKVEAPKPTSEPEDLFAVAVRNIKPLGGKGRKVPAPKKQIAARLDAEMSLADYMAARVEFAISASDEYLEGSAVGLDPLVMNRLREGQFSPEAHLDLHGLNADQAFEALQDFMRQCWFKGLRTALIVTGRGHNSPGGMSILRHKLPYWLTHEPFKRVVLAFCTAKPHDGGPGSIYVLMRKARKKGPIRWEMLAFDSDDF